MPIALDPEATHEYVLERDQKRPDDERPTFVFRYMTKRQLREFEQWRKGGDDEDVFDALDAAISNRLVGWRSMHDGKQPVPFVEGESQAGDVCTPRELIELQNAIVDANTLDTLQKKDSGSP